MGISYQCLFCRKCGSDDGFDRIGDTLCCVDCGACFLYDTSAPYNIGREIDEQEVCKSCQSDIGVMRLLDAKDRLTEETAKLRATLKSLNKGVKRKNEEIDRLKREISESRLAESLRIHHTQKMAVERYKASDERDAARAVAEEYKCQLADIVEKNRKMEGDYENLLKKVGEQVSVIGRLKGQADRAKTCPRCATLESVLRYIHGSLSRRIDAGDFYPSRIEDVLRDVLTMVRDYMRAVDVKPQSEQRNEDDPDVTI